MQISKNAIIVAMETELKPILNIFKDLEIISFQNRKFYTNKNVYILESGIGEINSASATEAIINLANNQNYKINFIINIGLCGCLKQNQFKIGDVLMIKDIVHYDFDISGFSDLKLGQYPNEELFIKTNTFYFEKLQKIYKEKIKLVRCASGDKFISKDKTNFLIQNFNADICEMESFGILFTAKKHNIETIFLKAISDITTEIDSKNKFLESTKKIVNNYIDALKLIINYENDIQNIQKNEIKKISSFKINHDKLCPGFYLSQINKDIFTYDLRFKKPNSNDFIPNDALHSIEHQMATFFRNSEIKENVIYFGPMGCRTGFYLILKNIEYIQAKKITEKILKQTINSPTLFGSKIKECGNSKEHNLKLAKILCKEYLLKIDEKESFFYEK